MKLGKKLLNIALAATLICSTVLLGACGNGEETGSEASKETEYKVAVKDALGNPYTEGVVVQFHKDGAQVAMQIVNPETGVAAKTLEKGDYTVKLQFTDGPEGYYYVEEGLTLSADKTEVEVILSKAITGEAISLSVGNGSYDAYAVGTGCTHVELKAGERNYFLFTPTQQGTYEFSAADGANVTVGYYGAPHFVQSHNAAEDVKDGKFTISVSASMIGKGDTGTTVLVIGIDSEAATECILGVNRIGDAKWTEADEPWTIYKATTPPAKYILPVGTKLTAMDITKSYTVVYNKTDGYYHLNTEDGPLVYVQLVEDSKYLASFKNILDRSGVSRYFYDKDGKFEKKVSYSECLLEYIGFADEGSGVYPLTEDLKHIIINRGEYVGWFDATSSQYLFKDADGNPLPGINPESAWLFMCFYAN